MAEIVIAVVVGAVLGAVQAVAVRRSGRTRGPVALVLAAGVVAAVFLLVAAALGPSDERVWWGAIGAGAAASAVVNLAWPAGRARVHR